MIVDSKTQQTGAMLPRLRCASATLPQCPQPNMTRPLIHRLIALSLLLAGTAAAAEPAPNPHVRPNIIFILTDDQRADEVDYGGEALLRTPHLAQLAAEGVRFDHALVNSAICTPSRICFFLGQYERMHGVNFNSGTSLAPQAWQQGYPIQLRHAGYFTGYIGKNHMPLGPHGYDSGIIERSFDLWYAGHNHLTFYPKQRHPIFRDSAHETQIEILGEATESFLDHNASFIEGAVAFLQSRPTDRPFCLSVAFNAPHAAATRSMQQHPTDSPLYRTAYRDAIDRLPIPENYVPKAGIATPKLPADVLAAEHRQPSYSYVDQLESLQEQRVRRYQLITGIDQFVGSLREQLQRLQLADNTVIIFTSDHGIMLGEHGLGGKALNYDPCLRVPMIVHDPRLPAERRGKRLEELVMSVDVAPTILDLAGAAIPAAMQGRSLLPIVRGEAVAWRRYAFAENLWSTRWGNPRIESLQDQRWKYIRYFATDRSLFDETDRPYRVTPAEADAYEHWLTASLQGLQPDHEELFDLQADPQETINLVDDTTHQTKATELRAALDRLVRQAKGDPQAKPQTIRLVPESD